ncbi:DNA sulfur modification protein DndE [Cronobacter dublinensis]|uniref:DNA sulfur modification protein DndE n=1 Tax=Cronobacter dublinensis TaxID=413497 RepID=UPI000CFD1262|nr:DNA sulfur modification protein DndE [Cronobacter dublinensis]MDI7505591.1 DNA sulfur modification protein DndE [Cronobacter dublinensis]
MLPNRMQLTRQTEEQLKRLKIFTGLTPNISARLAFFRSIEGGFRYLHNGNNKKLDGTLILDKITWLGDTLQVTELLLKMTYPDLGSKDLLQAWASHVEDGIAPLRNYKSLNVLSTSL